MSIKDVTHAGGFAVITGAAHGLGASAAAAWAGRGLDLVLVDRDAEALTRTADAMKAAYPDRTILTEICDVSDAQAMLTLADRVFAQGAVRVLMNNAGIAGMRSGSWTAPDAWQAILSVNLMGVINGQMAFLPRMIDAGLPAMVINTGSKQGITSPPGNPAYNVSKAGVKVATEMLAHELRKADAPISAHLFVPGFVYSNMVAQFVPAKPDGAWTPDQTVDHLLTRLEVGDFYILCPDNAVSPQRDAARVAWAAGDLIENRPALSRWHPDWEEAFAAHEADALKG